MLGTFRLLTATFLGQPPLANIQTRRESLRLIEARRRSPVSVRSQIPQLTECRSLSSSAWQLQPAMMSRYGQTYSPYLAAAPAAIRSPLMLLCANHLLLQDLSEDEIGSLAVSTLALLRGDPESSDDSRRSYPLPSPSTRRRRKPARPTVRTLF